MFGMNGGEAALLVVLGVLPLLLLVAVAVWGLRLQTRVRRLEAHRPAGEADVAALRAEIAAALRHVAVVRYDAFGDMGGRLSFSAALVDDAGDGVVISAIHARGESRTYAKGLVSGRSDTTLTPEEQQALAAARTGRAGA
ncbi:DUF4446 family protein [Nostocoides sp. F2B08]|uniref:DUF4446 family protein n=1 Tax=Nostocoides sp. F2B08 TaxID=2653936 RepID=UPI0012633C3A|nr:DUF4446 family protein [Tetrasphaera sp. F2B08]KAB7744015.1 DUF4446 family protein [Tetrasphaera sp. F2B08]